jgi:hypothetical protein
MTCVGCQRKIAAKEQFVIQDKTGYRFCLECGEWMIDVQMCEPRGCSCSRGGNAVTCECRGRSS